MGKLLTDYIPVQASISQAGMEVGVRVYIANCQRLADEYVWHETGITRHMHVPETVWL